MVDINLLGSQKKTTEYSKTISSFIAMALAVALVLVLIYYAYLFIGGRRTAAHITTLQEEITAAEAKIQSNVDKNELFTRQAQLKDLSVLLKDHIYWSALVPELARTTLRSAAFTSFSLKENGDVSMIVDVPSYAELDKFLQVFDLPEFNQNVSNVRVQSVVKVQRENSLRINAKVEFSYRISALKKTSP
jgi:cell division protein FtsB